MIGKVDEDSRIILEWLAAAIITAAIATSKHTAQRGGGETVFIPLEAVDQAVGAARRLSNEILPPSES